MCFQRSGWQGMLIRGWQFFVGGGVRVENMQGDGMVNNAPWSASSLTADLGCLLRMTCQLSSGTKMVAFSGERELAFGIGNRDVLPG